MSKARRYYDSLLVPPLELPWCEAGTLGNLAGCEALIHRLHRTGRLKLQIEQSVAICLKQYHTEMLHPY
jgi:hypothetical protein